MRWRAATHRPLGESRSLPWVGSSDAGVRGVGAARAVACALLLAGCTATPPATISPPPSISPTSAVSSARPTPTTTITTRSYATARFGGTHRWDDGLSIKVGKPASFWPSGWVREVNDFTHFRVMTVTIHNGTGATVDLSGLRFDGRSAGKAADSVHDPGKVGPAAPTRLAKGKSATFRIALGVAKPTDFQLQVTPDADHQPVVFQH